jgi:hypothetical protein
VDYYGAGLNTKVSSDSWQPIIEKYEKAFKKASGNTRLLRNRE